jgi:Tol biopolymer transport system component
MIASRTLPLVLLALVACKDHSQVAVASAATLAARGLGDSAVTVRRILVDSGQFSPWSPSADGRLMSGLDYKTGNVVLRDMRTGDRRTLTTGADWLKTNVEGDAPIISPNGKLVAYAWQNGAPTYAYELRVVGADGTGERVLLEPNAAIVEEYPLDWAPDSRSVLADLYGRDGSTQLVLADAATNAVKVVRSFDWRGHGNAKFSPDGSWIAYDFQPDGQRDGREIVLLRLADGRESRVTSDAVPKGLVGWSASGDGVFYRTVRGESSTIWYLALENGHASGAPRLVRSDVWGAKLLGVAQGTLYYTLSDVRQAIYTIPVDLEAGRVLAPPAPAVTGTSMRGPAAWSPDGRQLAFVRVTDDQRLSLVMRDVVANDERVLPLRLQYGFAVKWTPDGRSVLVIARERNRWGSHLVDLTTGKTRLVSPIESPLGSGGYVDLSADGRTVYLTRNRPAPLDSGVVIAKDLASGAERELYRGSQVGGVTLSPDQSTLAFVRSAIVDVATTACCAPFGSQSRAMQLVTMPVGGGAPRVLYTGGVGPLSLNWSRDGSRIVFGGGERTGNEMSSHLSVVNVVTGQVQRLLSQQEQTGGPRLSPDGRHITFWNTVGGKTSELWAMENLPGGPRR